MTTGLGEQCSLNTVAGVIIGVPELVAICAPYLQAFLPGSRNKSFPLLDLTFYGKYNPGERLNILVDNGQTKHSNGTLTHNPCSSEASPSTVTAASFSVVMLKSPLLLTLPPPTHSGPTRKSQISSPNKSHRMPHF